MVMKLSEHAADWIEEAIAVHEAVSTRLRASIGRNDAGRTALADQGSIIEAAATITAAIVTRAGATGPYDLLEIDEEATAAEEERRRAIHPQ